MRKATLDAITALRSQQVELVEEIASRPSGLFWCSLHSQIADQAATWIYRDSVESLGKEPNLAIIATGGYGRSELCPNSDIDITIVPGDESSAHLDPLIRQLFQDIHWAYSTVLRLDVGYAYRLISDVSGLDAKSRTGLLDMRLLAGSQEIFQQLQNSLEDHFPVGEFLTAKLAERREMYAKYHDTPLVIEPHLKEGAGGLRDFHCASWIGEAIGERAVRPTHSYDTILKYRNLLHYLSKKTHDVLTRSRQSEIAEILGTTPSMIVSEVSIAGEDLHKSLRRTTERLFETRFTLSPGVVSVVGEVRVLPGSTAGSAATGVAIATQLGLRVSDLPSQASNPYAGPSAAFAIAQGEKTLRNLDRCSLLEQLVPELTACRNLSSDEGTHLFTVMEHTLRVVRNLDQIEPPGFLGEIKSSLTDLKPLYLAAIFHDVAKRDPMLDHSVAGAEIVARVAREWELSAATIDLASWLVREHLTMARFLRIRDLAHPSTIEEFGHLVQTVERLRTLTLLTWADVNAVGPGAWTLAQENFLKLLYERTFAMLEGESVQKVEVSQSRQKLLRQLSKMPVEREKVQAFVDSLPAYYLTSTTADLVRLHMELAERALNGELTIEYSNRPDIGSTELTVCWVDHPGLLSQILGGLYSMDLSLQGIRACTTSSATPVAIDVFTISFGGRPVPLATMSATTTLLKNILLGGVDLDTVMREKDKDPDRRQKVLEWSYVPGRPGILELKTPSGRGMGFRFSRLFAQQGWNIVAARVGQWAGSGTAAFYLSKGSGEELFRSEVAPVLDSTLGL